MAAWECPACGRTFGRRNQSHVCAPAMPRDEYYAGRPAFERAIGEAVIECLQACGPLDVEAVSVGVLLRRARTFAELRPARGRVVLSILLSRRLDHPRVRRCVRASGSRFAHFMDLVSAAEVDEDVRVWLTEAYDSSPV